MLYVDMGVYIMMYVGKDQKGKSKSIKKIITYVILALAFASLGIAYPHLGKFFDDLKNILLDIIKPMGNLNAFTILAILVAIFFLSMAIMTIKDMTSKQKNKGHSLFSNIPSNYHLFSNFTIDNIKISNILICPKGIYTIYTNQGENLKGEHNFSVIKQSILQSKLLNDFMQKMNIGNFYVKTIVVLDDISDRAKQHFPDMPILQPDKLDEYLNSLDDKYSDSDCADIAKRLNEALVSNDNFAHTQKTTSKRQQS